eukprot:601902-Pelagomonas_calceolata.AAC.1
MNAVAWMELCCFFTPLTSCTAQDSMRRGNVSSVWVGKARSGKHSIKAAVVTNSVDQEYWDCQGPIQVSVDKDGVVRRKQSIQRQPQPLHMLPRSVILASSFQNRVKATKLALKFDAHSVQYASKLASTRRGLDKASLNSHYQDQ